MKRPDKAIEYARKMKALPDVKSLADWIDHLESQQTITLRDKFAGDALAGFYSSDTTRIEKQNDIAEHCYKQADAMLKAR